MRCLKCGGENPEGAKFCIECGGPLHNRCPSCGGENPPRAKFCAACGTGLGTGGKPAPGTRRKGKGAKTSEQAPRPQARPTLAKSQGAAPEAERRQLTVMFCDLVGSTSLSQQLDPEELRTVILAYQEACARAIRRCGGYLARYVGDGLLVYFGYPQAHEDDAQRAIRAGLGIVAALPELNTQLQQTVKGLRDFPLQVRIGMHTGLVVVGDMGGGGYRDPQAVVGETPNIAARVQGIAEANTVVISEATYRLVRGLFEYQDCGPQALKGVAAPVPVYRVLRESGAQSRFEVALSTGLTPLIGREHEVGLLQERWRRAKQGAGQAALLSGEPGIGKSRLVQTLKEQVISEGATRIEFRCSAYHQNSAFYPIIEHLQRFLQFAPHDPPQEKLSKLQQTLRSYRFPQADTLPLLAALLSLPPPDGSPPLTFSPQKQKQKTQEALVAWIVEEAERAPVFCAWEDLHWADPSTLEILTLFLDQVPAARLLAVLTFRPEFMPPWGNRSHISQLTLSRLDRPQVETMVEKITDGKALPPEVAQQIAGKTDGVPLFVEELTRMVLESGLLTAIDNHYELTGPLPLLAIPSTLQDSLMARLDRLAPVREIAQLGATIGREFSYELLQAVSPLDEATLQRGLKQLVEAELAYQRGLGPQAHYLFKHALIQDTAYQSLLKSARQQYHRQIAQVLVDRFPETVETQPELVAQHFTEAGLIEQAIPYWQKAGEQATQRSAYVEAMAHLATGLELLKTLPDTPERAQQELTLQLALGAALFAVKGYAAPEVEKTYTRARELCQLGETPQLVPVLQKLVVFYFNRGEIRTAHELAEQAMHLAQSIQDPYLLSVAHDALGWTLYLLGELTSARPHLEQALALYNPQQPPHPTIDTFDPRMECLSVASWTLWTLGYPDQALKRSDEALTLAAELSRPFALAHTLGFAAMFHLLRREAQLARERAEAVITLSTEQGFPYWLGWGTMVRGWALAEQGQVHEGIAQMRQSQNPFILALLAEACGKVGQVEEGLTMLTKVLAFVDKTGVRYSEAETYRLKGELKLQSCRVGMAHQDVRISEAGTVGGAHPTGEDEAEACFLKAIEIARKQQAKSLELRAVMSMSRLWQRQGKQAEAHTMLSEIYGWFTEGFETKDLQEAKALLEELNR
jgi:class 3 adenylate cyclase/tetratricopeptide (TPR) repeat protein